MLRLSACSIFLCIASLVCVPVVAQASIAFGDVGYDVPGSDDGREWVAIQNVGSTPIDLSGWKFFEGGVNHKLIPIATSVIPVNGSAVIVSSFDGYRADHPGYAGLLFKSSFSLSNSGETLSLKNASGTVMASVTYTPKPTPPKPHTSTALKVISQPVGNPVESARVEATSTPTTAPLTSAGTAPGAMLPWIGGVVVVIVIGVGAAFMMRPPPKTEADDYHITEEKL